MKVTFLLHEPVRDEFLISFPKSLPWVPEFPFSRATNWRMPVSPWRWGRGR